LKCFQKLRPLLSSMETIISRIFLTKLRVKWLNLKRKWFLITYCSEVIKKFMWICFEIQIK
jgi:hypothetical protein